MSEFRARLLLVAAVYVLIIVIMSYTEENFACLWLQVMILLS